MWGLGTLPDGKYLYGLYKFSVSSSLPPSWLELFAVGQGLEIEKKKVGKGETKQKYYYLFFICSFFE